MAFLFSGGKIHFFQSKKQLANGFEDSYSDNPNDPILEYEKLTQSSTTMYHTYPAFRSAVMRLSDYCIGTGLVFESEPSASILEVDQKKLSEFSKQFEALLKIQFLQSNFYEKQSSIFENALIQGDSILNLFIDGSELNFLVYRGSEIDHTKEYLGIKSNALGQPIGCFFREKKEFEKFKDKERLRFLQFFIPEIAGQKRGYPIAYNMLNLSKGHHLFQDATVSRALIESVILGTSAEKTPGNFGRELAKQDIKAAAGLLPRISNKFFSKKIRREDAGTLILPGEHGDKINQMQSLTPSKTYDDFNRWILKFFAMSIGISPNILSADHTQSSYATAKAEQDYAYKRILKLRQHFIGQVLQPVLKEMLLFFLDQKLIKLPKDLPFPSSLNYQFILNAYCSGHFVGPKFSAINPLQEARAQAELIKNGMSLRANYRNQENNADLNSFTEKWKEEKSIFEQEKGHEKN